MLVGYPPSPDQVNPNPFFVFKLLTSTFRASLDFLRTSMTVALQAMESWQLRPLSRLTSSEISALRSHFAWHPDGSMGYHKTIGFPVKMTRACDADSLGSPILGELLGSWGWRHFLYFLRRTHTGGFRGITHAQMIAWQFRFCGCCWGKGRSTRSPSLPGGLEGHQSQPPNSSCQYDCE